MFRLSDWLFASAHATSLCCECKESARRGYRCLSALQKSELNGVFPCVPQCFEEAGKGIVEKPLQWDSCCTAAPNLHCSRVRRALPDHKRNKCATERIRNRGRL